MKSSSPSSSSLSSSSLSTTSSSSSSSSSNSSSINQLLEKPKNSIKTKRVLKKNGNNPVEKSKNNTSKKDSNSGSRRSSIFRGVTRHRWTGRFEAHLWDKNTWNFISNKKGRQVYLGAYDSEEAAARTYDLAAIKYWGPDTSLNYPIETYKKELEEMENSSKEEYLACLRRQSSGFSRGVSKYRGVARHHHNGRWEARIGRVLGNKYLYLGTYSTQEEAAAAYDMAAIQYRGAGAVTNFDVSNYADYLNIQQQKQPEQQQKQPEQQLPNLICQTESPEIEQQQQQQQQQQHQEVNLPQPQNSQIQPLPCYDYDSMMDEENTLIFNHDDCTTWSLCLETELGFNDIPFLQNPGGGGDDDALTDLFDSGSGGGFENNIDVIFNEDNNDFNYL